MIRFTDLLEAETSISEKKALWWTEISTKRLLISLILFRFSIMAVDKERKGHFGDKRASYIVSSSLVLIIPHSLGRNFGKYFQRESQKMVSQT